MREKKEDFQKFIKSEMEREAEEIRRELQEEDAADAVSGSESLPAEARKRIREGLDKKIRDYEKENLYVTMSEEDKEALRLGRELMQKQAGENKTDSSTKTGFVVRKKTRRRTVFVLAAVLVLVIAVGLTSTGVMERVINNANIVVGDRDVVQVDSWTEKKLIVEENEEKAYQFVGETFKAEPVRIAIKPTGMEFQKMQYDKESQIAELYYSYEGERIIYMMSPSHRNFSWGIDVDDVAIKEYEKQVRDCAIQIKEYAIPESNINQYSAKFSYKDIEYYMLARMNQTEFEIVLENLYFFS